MCCITLTALAATMPTTEVKRDVKRKPRNSWVPQITERAPVRMNWVVDIDENGKRQLRMHWYAKQRR
jgi:hypothetical protein